MSQSGTLILIPSIAPLAPLSAHGIGRRLPVPPVIFEALLSILIGPGALGWAGDGKVIDTLSNLGLAMLIFLAGAVGESQGWAGPAVSRIGLR
jgi:Kef-type K+ transport system membrane component KefB